MIMIIIIIVTIKGTHYKMETIFMNTENGMKLSIYLMVLILLLIYRIILNLLSRNMKLYLKILQYRFIQTKLKIELFSK